MTSQLLQQVLPRSPLRNERGEFDVAGLCETFGLSAADVGGATGASRQTMANSLAERRFVELRSPALREFFEKLELIHSMLLSVTDPQTADHDIVTWFHARNRALQLARPADLVREGKIDDVIAVLRDVVNPSHGG